MTIWILAILLTAIACAALLFAGSGKLATAGASAADATQAHFRAQLAAIDADASAGRLGGAEAVAAKAELAREVIRLKDEVPETASTGGRGLVVGVTLLVAVLSLGTYWMLGKPDLPAEPLAGRTAEAGAGLDLDKAVKTIEDRLAQDPSDVRGWKVIGPVYMQLGRYADAAKAYAKLNALQPPTADSLSDQGEATMMAANGNIDAATLDLFRKAAALDPKHVRSRFYIASEETKEGQYAQALADWNALLALGKGDEPWVVTAQQGRDFAQNALNPQASSAAAPNADQIAAMVDGLEARLKSSGGTIDEWTRLVRSRLVQGRAADAQADYDLARAAYPNAQDRADLDSFALQNGLVAK